MGARKGKSDMAKTSWKTLTHKPQIKVACAESAMHRHFLPINTLAFGAQLQRARIAGRDCVPKVCQLQRRNGQACTDSTTCEQVPIPSCTSLESDAQETWMAHLD